jgi:hypothetical protein
VSEVGEFRRGQVVQVNADGSALVEWEDGTTSTLKAKPTKPRDTWEDSVRKTGKCGDKLCACATLNLNEDNEESRA